MKNKTIKVHRWHDIQEEISKEMGIDNKDFRRYNNVIGGESKDLWHEWLDFFYFPNNDTIVREDLGDAPKYVIEYAHEKGKGWLEPFINAVYRVWDKHEIEYVEYSW